MSTVSWIKIQTDLFENRKIRRIMAKEDGDSIALLWVRLLTLAGEINDGGAVYFSKSEPYTAESLAEVFGKPVELVGRALDMFVQFEMIEVDEDGVIFINGWSEYQNADKLEAIREYNREATRKAREKKKSEQMSNDCQMSVNDKSMTMSNDCQTRSEKEKRSKREKEKEEDKDIDIEREEDACACANNIRVPSPREIGDYIREKNYNVDVKRFVEYYSKRGWKNKNGDSILGSWRQTVDSWAVKEKPPDRVSARQGSFDTADFFAAALRRTYKVTDAELANVGG